MARITENSGSTFISKGGELGIQVHSNVTWNFTLDGNGNWLKIKNQVGEQVNSITGKNDSIITLVAKENEGDENRSCYGYCDSEQYDSPTEHDATVKIFQFGSYFYLNGVSAVTLSVQSAVTNPYTFVVDTSYNVNDIVVTVTGNSSIVQDKTLTQNSFAISFYDNEDETAKTATVEFRKDNKLVGKLSITQRKAVYYFEINSEDVDVNDTIGVSGGEKRYWIDTNYKESDVTYTISITGGTEGDTIESERYRHNTSYSINIKSNSLETGKTIKINFKGRDGKQLHYIQIAQQAESYTFTINPTAVTAQASDISCETDITTNYTTEMLNAITFDRGGASWLTNPRIDGTKFKADLTPNTATTANSTTVTFKRNGNTIATFNVTQNGIAESFKWNDVDTQNYQITGVVNTGTTKTLNYTNTYQNLSESHDEMFENVSLSSINGNGQLSFTVKNNTGDSRTGIIKIKNNGTEIGYQVTVQQDGTNYYLRFPNTTATSKTETVEYTATSVTVAIETNAPELTTEKTGIVDSISTATTSMTINFSTNTGTSQREGTAKVSYGGSALTVTIQQTPEPVYEWKWNDGSTAATSSYTYNTQSSLVFGATTTYVDVNYYVENDTVSWMRNVSISSDGKQVTIGNLDAYGEEQEQREHRFTICCSSTTINPVTLGYLTIQQSPKPFFKWWNSSTAITTTDVNYNGATLTSGYTTNYTSLLFTSNQSWCTTAVTSTGVSATLTANSDTANTRSATITVKNGSTTVGTWSITQQKKPEDKYLWIIATGQTTASTLNVTNAGTSLSYDILTNYEQSELDGFTPTKPSWITNVKLTKSTLKLTFDVAANPVGASSRSDNVVIGGLTVTVSQVAGEAFKANLNVNNSTSPANISNTATTFSISTLPNSDSLSYTIKVDSTEVITKTGSYGPTNYTCGENTATTEVTYTVRVYSGSTVLETVTIKQNGKPTPTTRRVTLNIVGSTNVQIANNTGVDVSLDLRGESTVGYFDDIFVDGPIDVGAYQTIEQVSVYGSSSRYDISSTASSINLTLKLKDGNNDSDGYECTLTYDSSNYLKNNFSGGWCEFNEISFPITPGTSDITLTLTINDLNIHE